MSRASTLEERPTEAPPEEVEEERQLTLVVAQACASGPLAEEPVHGVLFRIEAVFVDALDLEEGDLHAYVTSMTKQACRVAYLTSAPRCVEARCSCELHCAQEHVGKMYGLLNKRRGAVLDEDLLHGTDLFVVRASLPAADAVGFSAELLEWTSGAATAPQMAFDGYATLEQDPFWKPTTEDEREEHGDNAEKLFADNNRARNMLNAVRRRKGLPYEAKTLDRAAEAQKSNNRIRG